jgi:hypothetical protein
MHDVQDVAIQERVQLGVEARVVAAGPVNP